MPLKASSILLDHKQITTSVHQMVPLSPKIDFAASKIVLTCSQKPFTTERLTVRKNSTIHGTLLPASVSVLSFLGGS